MLVYSFATRNLRSFRIMVCFYKPNRREVHSREVKRWCFTGLFKCEIGAKTIRKEKILWKSETSEQHGAQWKLEVSFCPVCFCGCFYGVNLKRHFFRIRSGCSTWPQPVHHWTTTFRLRMLKDYLNTCPSRNHSIQL